MSTTHACGHGNWNQAGQAQKTPPLCATGLSLHVRLPPAQVVELSPLTGDPMGGIPRPQQGTGYSNAPSHTGKGHQEHHPQRAPTSSSNRGYALNACVCPHCKIHMLKPNTQQDGAKKQGLREVIRSGGWSPHECN